jgi:hypothetical protein
MRPATPTRHEVEVKPPISSVTPLRGPLPDDPVELWSMVINASQKQHRMRLLVGNLRLVSKDDERAVLAVSDEMRTAALSAERDLCTLLSVAWGQNLKIELTSASGERLESTAPPPSPAAQEAAPQALPPIHDHPLIKNAVELFGARIISTQARKRPPA